MKKYLGKISQNFVWPEKYPCCPILQFSQLKIEQFELSGRVLESSEPADFQTVLTFLIWWRFRGVINEIQKSKDVKNKDYPWCVQAPISLLLIGQNPKVRTVLKTSESADFQNFPIFSRESDSTIANVCVCPSVCQSPKPLSLSESCLSAKSAHQP